MIGENRKEAFGMDVLIAGDMQNDFLSRALGTAEAAVDASCRAGVTPESHRNAREAMRVCQITAEHAQMVLKVSKLRRFVAKPSRFCYAFRLSI